MLEFAKIIFTTTHFNIITKVKEVIILIPITLCDRKNQTTGNC